MSLKQLEKMVKVEAEAVGAYNWREVRLRVEYLGVCEEEGDGRRRLKLRTGNDKLRKRLRKVQGKEKERMVSSFRILRLQQLNHNQHRLRKRSRNL